MKGAVGYLWDYRALPIPERLRAIAEAGRAQMVNGFSFNETQTVAEMLDEIAAEIEAKGESHE